MALFVSGYHLLVPGGYSTWDWLCFFGEKELFQYNLILEGLHRQKRRTGYAMFAGKQGRVIFMDFARWCAGRSGQVGATAKRLLCFCGRADKGGMRPHRPNTPNAFEEL